MASNNSNKQIQAVYAIREDEDGKSYWTRIGVAFVNKNGSLNLALDAVPVATGKLHVRDFNRANEGAAAASEVPNTAPRTEASWGLFVLPGSAGKRRRPYPSDGTYWHCDTRS